MRRPTSQPIREVEIATIDGGLKTFLQGASPGETIVLLDKGRPFAHVRPLPTPPAGGKRPLGIYKGKFTVPNDLDDPLPDDIIATFYPEEEL